MPSLRSVDSFEGQKRIICLAYIKLRNLTRYDFFYERLNSDTTGAELPVVVCGSWIAFFIFRDASTPFRILDLCPSHL